MAAIQTPVFLSQINEIALDFGDARYVQSSGIVEHNGGKYDFKTLACTTSQVIEVQLVECVPPQVLSMGHSHSVPNLVCVPKPMALLAGRHEDTESLSVLLSELGYDVVFLVGSLQALKELENHLLATLLESQGHVDIRVREP